MRGVRCEKWEVRLWEKNEKKEKEGEEDGESYKSRVFACIYYYY